MSSTSRRRRGPYFNSSKAADRKRRFRAITFALLVLAGGVLFIAATPVSDALTITKVADPASLPASGGQGNCWSHDGTFHMEATDSTSAGIKEYSVSGATFTAVAFPTVNQGQACAFSPDDTYLAVASLITPFIVLYTHSGTTFTQLSNPATLPTASTDVAWDPTGTLLAVAHDTSPYITIYQRSGSTFTKLSNPATLPGGQVRRVAFSHDGAFLALGEDVSPYVLIYSVSGTTFTKVADPATLPTNVVFGIAWSPTDTYLSVGENASPFFIQYTHSGSTFTKVADPGTLPANIPRRISWSPGGTYVYFGQSASPYVFGYSLSGATFTKVANPATLPGGAIVQGTSFSPNATYLTLTETTSPFIVVYTLDAPDASPATAPTVAATGGSSAVALTWTSVATATSYNVYYSAATHASTSPMNASAYIYAGSFACCGTNVTALSAGTTYYFRVVAANSGGEGPASSEVTATTLPPAVAVFVVVNSTSQVNLSWTANADTTVTTTQIWRNGTRFANVTPRTQGTWVDTNVTPGVDYTYAVSSFSPTGEGPLSATLTGHALQLLANQIAGFTVTNQSGAVRLDWAATSDANATGYRIYRNGTTAADVTPATVTTWSDTNVSPNVAYNYSMSTKSPDSFGPTTANQSGTLYVDAPHHFAVANTTAAVILSWDSSIDTNVTTYDVLRNGSFLASVGAPTVSYNDTSGIAAVNYTYSVDARVNATIVSAATTGQLGHKVSTPTTVGGVTATPIQNAIRVSWTLDTEPNLQYYAVYRSTLPNVTPTTNLIGTTMTASLSDSTGHAGTRYYYRVLAINNVGDASSPSLDATTIFPTASGGAGGGAPASAATPTSSATAAGGGASGGTSAAAAGGRTLQDKGIHIERANPLTFTWWQVLFLVIGFGLVTASLPYSRIVWGRLAVPPQQAALGVLGGVFLWSVVFIPLLFH